MLRKWFFAFSSLVALAGCAMGSKDDGMLPAGDTLVEGMIMDISLSARIILLEEPVEGIAVIALMGILLCPLGS